MSARSLLGGRTERRALVNGRWVRIPFNGIFNNCNVEVKHLSQLRQIARDEQIKCVRTRE